MDSQTQLDCLNKMKDTATKPSGYMNTSRILASISNETLPLNHSFQQNHQYINSEITQLDNDEVEKRDVPHDHNAVYNDIDPALLDTEFIDVTEEQDKMCKRFSRMTFTRSDEACMDLFHILKTSNVPLVMFNINTSVITSK